MVRCHDCDVEEGQLHILGCDMERCPMCLGQLISCDCPSDLKEMLRDGDRIPWVQIPVLCALCGEVFPEFFNVPDEEWKKHVIPPLQNKVLCRSCFEKQKKLFPNGWRMQ